jgi:hypothetical protein
MDKEKTIIKKEENMLLSQMYSPEKLMTVIKPLEQWQPFPKGADRPGWSVFGQAFRRAHIEKAARLAKKPWPQLTAENYLQFARSGNRSHYEAPYFMHREILAEMVIAECMQGEGRFIDAIANAVWSICEESSWCLPAHTAMQSAGSGLPDTSEPVVDLFAAETSALLAWTLYLLGPRLGEVSPQVPARIEREVQFRVLIPNLARDDFWWMGFSDRQVNPPDSGRVNNWNPWINSNWLASILLVEKDEERRISALYKSMHSLDVFISSYPDDGGCDEGPSYWTRAAASMFDCLELLHSASGGQIDIYNEPVIQNMGKFIYRAHIDGEYFVNFADAPARLRPDASLVFRYGQCIGDPQMMAFGAWIAHREDLLNKGFSKEGDVASSLGRVLPTLFTLTDLAKVEPKVPLVRDAWLDKIQVVAARDQANSSRGLYLAAKGGHNNESHNHNDMGHFVVYTDGKPLIIDAGVETYTRKTFSAQRYEIWTMQSAYHSLPTVDGVMQAPGPEFKASQVTYQASQDAVRFSLDIAGAYPPEARLKRWLRTITFQRGQSVLIEDQYELASPAKELTLSLVTPCKVQISAPGELLLSKETLAGGRKSGSGKILYDPGLLAPALETIPITDEQLGSTWGDHLVRILFKAVHPSLSGGWTLQINPAKAA